MLGVPILFLETYVCYIGDIQQEDGVGNSIYCLPDVSIWMTKWDFRLDMFRADLLIVLPFTLFLPR